jgi:hypothetical protein
MPAAGSSLFLEIWVSVLTSLYHFIPFNDSLDTWFCALYATPSNYLQLYGFCLRQRSNIVCCMFFFN